MGDSQDESDVEDDVTVIRRDLFEANKTPAQMILSRNNSFVIDSENSGSSLLNDNEEHKYSAFKKSNNLKEMMIKSNQGINKDIRKQEIRTLSPRAVT
jgi:hypothetical protein